ncbi:MAG: leucyl/phenylalanyl-tRNA--protein transferase [Pseudomonadota bacterium]|nr:leucyl/phenylalanyl-tRNA--protein transferase [Pseudomonadota bacterium]
MFLSTNLVLKAYEKGIFPMSDSNSDPYIFWVEPKERGIIDLNDFKISKSLKKIIKKEHFRVEINSCFEKVINLCAKNQFRNTSWINSQIIESYIKLHKLGFAVSVECFSNNLLVGGLYGLKFGEIFSGESMFSIEKNASKVALTYLVALLKQSKYKFIDTQFYSPHLKQFGTKKVSRTEYKKILKKNKDAKSISFPEKLDHSIIDYFS